MKHVSLALSVLLLAFAGVANLPTWRVPSAPAQGQSTANMVVLNSVPRRCLVTTAPLDFGTHDPISTKATSALDGQATLTVTCTKGVVVTIGIDNGSNARGQVRRMAGPRSFLNYDLYKDDARTQRWGTGAGETLDGGVAPSRDPRRFIVYGRVAGSQDVEEGAFQDTVVVTVNF